MQFKDSFENLNEAQKEAASHIDGPLLVIAGPGTGKTQLLSSRVAYILQNTDAQPENILCLTFTESGVLSMRERLASMIGPDSYNVMISTYHSFGSDIIKSYPQFFEKISTDRSDDVRMETPIDELGQYQVIDAIVNSLAFDNPLIGARYYVRSVVSTIGDMKKELISPKDLRKLANDNLAQSDSASELLSEIVTSNGGISRKKLEYLEQYQNLYDGLARLRGGLVENATTELSDALEDAVGQNSSRPLTKWKNKWLHKDEEDNYSLTDPLINRKMLALADIYEAYENQLKKSGQYDYDDMILRAIQALEENSELRNNLQEKYQYILLDEFQDTNPSQYKLVYTIANHPVHEGKPNIMAVGDDDQAIYAFQGADIGNMQEFMRSFREVSVVNLVENYRSHREILHVAHNISAQIENRLHRQIAGIEKVLVASSKNLPTSANLERHDFNSMAAEYGWVAEKISELVKSGEKPDEIAVLAPRHVLLEDLVPFLLNQSLPISYEKRENILETKLVLLLKTASELVIALGKNDQTKASELFPVVLSASYWNIAVEEIWKVNWQYANRDETRSWAEIALDSNSLRSPVLFYLALSQNYKISPLETTLDILTGTEPIAIGADGDLSSPLREYYFSKSSKDANPLQYYEALSHLSVIRSKLREQRPSDDSRLTLEGFVEMFDVYEAANQSLINSHPIVLADSAVQLMTAYKSKGLEFRHVFILSAHDDVWGSKARGSSNKIPLPENLAHIRYQSTSEDERKRLLFVAMTRAKCGLYITSYETKDNGKKNEPVKYLNEAEGVIAVMPKEKQRVNKVSIDAEMLSRHVETLWHSRHTQINTTIKSLLKERLQTYRMSPTHLNTFIDTEYGGPEIFLINSLLRFPQAPSADGEYGTAVHNTLEWYQNQINNGGHKPTIKHVLDRFEFELQRRYFSVADQDHARSKGRNTLKHYISSRTDMFSTPAKTEVNFYYEGVLVDGARLSGKIDRLEIDEKNKTVDIADYKTGSSFKSWKTTSSLKHIKYEQQLYLYKILIEGAPTFRGYKVQSARLEFVEPNPANNTIAPALYVEFDDQKEAELKRLVAAVWRKIMNVDMPDISNYPSDAKGAQKFISDLLKD